MNRIAGMLLVLVLLSGCSGMNIKPEFDPQIKASSDYFAGHPFTALVDFHVHGNHFIDSKGKPLPEKDQSARAGSKGLLTKKMAVAKGAQGHIFNIALKTENELEVYVSESSETFSAAWNPSNIFITYPRPITRDDLTPERLAKTLSSMMKFKDFQVGSEMDDVLKALEESK